ncbi:MULTISPECIES: hypothetical protein [unclassified Nocardioides]|uniref:hypothetical protein n=1 Tax=unclassified Nocardioides TaxID=2615069 RepID=UPI003014F502
MATTLAATEQRSRTSLGLALLGLAGVLLVVLAIGWYGAAAGYVHAERLDHPTVLTLAAGAAATVGLGLLLRGTALTVVVLIGLGATTLGCAALFALVSVFSASTWDDPAVVVTSPDGSLTTRVLTTGLSESYVLQVRQNDRGLRSRVIDLGCLDADANSLRALRWEGDELVADTSAGSIAITVPAPDSDRPVAWREVLDATLGEGAVGPVTLEEC